MMLTMTRLRISLLAVSVSTASAFRSTGPSASSFRVPTQLRDVHGWRDDDASPSREICLLPFSLEEVLLQGETKQLRLYEQRFIDLFDECMEQNHGIVGMGLIASATGILMHLPLCEVEAYNRSMKEMGIFVTIRAISRVELESITQEGPYIKATCTEVFDENTQLNLGRANLIASDIERAILQLSSLDSQLKTYDDEYEMMLAVRCMQLHSRNCLIADIICANRKTVRSILIRCRKMMIVTKKTNHPKIAGPDSGKPTKPPWTRIPTVTRPALGQ